MPYMIETFDKPGTLDLRARERDAHLAFLDAHKHLLLACGAKLDDEGNTSGGGLYVVALETRAEAEAFIAVDPFFTAGLFERVQITRWRKAYVDGVCYLPESK
ncbi:YciI family protein [Azorhizobium caulinodans]|uniref:YciI family protein n=1 Tax=Azorhizobium caulinodans TaxID=7 RepID=UPI002FBDCCA3